MIYFVYSFSRTSKFLYWQKGFSFWGLHHPDRLPGYRLGPNWRPGPTGMHVALGHNNP